MAATRHSWLGVSAGLAVCLAWVATAQAASDSVVVANLGQPGLVSSVSQAPATLAVRGNCTQPRTVPEANGAPSPCPSGTWPAPGGNWSPTLRVASNDQLQLTFATPESSVAVVGTSNYPVGLTTPDGTPVSNFDAGQFVVTATQDPARWLVKVPILDQRFQGAGAAIAVTASDAGGVGSDFSFSVALPRFPDFGNPCGEAYFGPGDVRYRCETPQPGGSGGATGGPPPPTGGPPPQSTPPLSTHLALLDRPEIAGGVLRVRFETPVGGVVTVGVRWPGHMLYQKRLRVHGAGVHSARVVLSSRARAALRAHRRRRVTVEIVQLDGARRLSRNRTARVRF